MLHEKRMVNRTAATERTMDANLRLPLAFSSRGMGRGSYLSPSPPNSFQPHNAGRLSSMPAAPLSELCELLP
jgi:hypothetical protein